MTRTEEEKFEDMFLVKMASKRTSLKTECLIIRSKARLSRLRDDLYISIEGEYVYRLAHHKLLAFVTDESVDWEDHINAVIKKVNCGISVLRSARRYLPV